MASRPPNSRPSSPPSRKHPRVLPAPRGGLGLGLAIVRGLVELHGGTVQLESEGLGRGTQVTLTLPLLAAHDPKEIPPTSRPSAPVAEGPPQRILLVEDNADAAQSLHAALSEQGHGVVTAMSAQEALDVTTTRAFDAVFCDIGLPDLDGYALAGALRERLGSSAALFALTGYAAPEDVARTRAAGFDQHLTKPPRLPELCALLAAYARRRIE